MPTTPTPTKTFPALHGWRRCGKRSTAPRATPQNTISSENRWFSRCSRCLRKQRGRRSSGGYSQHLVRAIKEIVVAKAKKKASAKPGAKNVGTAERVAKAAAEKKGAVKKAKKAKKKTAAKHFYITTAIAYPNGTPHIGHAY